MHISLIGKLTARQHNRPIVLPKSQKARALLGYLALRREGAARDELCHLLFSETKDPKASLRWAISRLKLSLPEPILVTSTRNKIQLDWSCVATDVEQLEKYLRLIRQDRTSWRQTAKFEAGLNGHLLDDLTIHDASDFENWRLTEDGHVRMMHEALLTELLQVCDDPRLRIDIARHLVNVEPLNEHGWAVLVRALMQAGQLQQAQRTHDLATKQFSVDGVPLNGELKQALLGATAQPLQKPSQTTTKKERTALAVLPCLSAHDSTISATLKDRVTEALYAAATANRACAVLGWSITSRAQADEPDGRTIGSRIGADIVLEARLHHTHLSYQLLMELVTVADGTCLFNWSKEFKGYQSDELAPAVRAFFSARFEIDLQMALIALALAKSPHERGLWDQYFLALPRIYAASGHDPVESLGLLDTVIASEPTLGPAVCAAAWVRTTHPQFNQNAADIATTASLARRAIELCQDDPFVMSLASIVIASTERDLETAADLVRRAQTFNPHSTMAYLACGIVEHYRGNHAEALRLLEQPTLTLDTEPLTFALYAFAALCCYFLGDPETGLQFARKSCGRNPSFVVGRRGLTLCLSACGHQAEAKAEALRLQALDPSEHISFYQMRSPYRSAQDIETMCVELRAVGVAASR